MKKHLIRLLPTLPLAFTAQAEILFQEQFTYDAGVLAGNTNSSSSTDWANNNGSATSVAAGRSLPPLAPTNFATAGGRANQPNANRVSLDLSSITGIATPAEGSTLYVSFVQKLGDDNAIDQAVIFELWNGDPVDNNTIFSFGTNNLDPATDYGLLIEKRGDNAVGVSLSSTVDTDTNLIVLRIDYGVGMAPDTVRIYKNPTGNTEPATPDGSDLDNTANHDFTFNAVGFGSFQRGTQQIDEIRITTTFEEAVPLFKDTDGDMIPDSFETANNLNPNDASDANADPDMDDLSNLREFQNSTNPQDPDSDDDGLNDKQEVDGTLNPYKTEQVAGEAPLGAPGAPTDPLNPDSDGDQISDNDEVKAGDDTFISNPNLTDTDGDALPDFFEVNGMLDPADPNGVNGPNGDKDGDNLFNDQELDRGTNPSLRDTDNDGYDDGVEDNFGSFDTKDATGTDPLNPDTDGDGILDGNENPDEGVLGGPIHASDPTNENTDGDDFNDNVEIFFNTNPILNEAPFPPTDPIVATVQFDIDGGPGTNNFQGLYAPNPPEDTIQTPAHAAGLLNDSDNIFNNVIGNTTRTLLDSSGSPVPGIGIDIGTATDNAGTLTFDFNNPVFGITGQDINVANPSIYDTPFYGDWLFTTDDVNIVVRVNGLAAGSYEVFFPLRESNQPDRTHDISFGTQAADGMTDPVFTTTQSSTNGAPATFIQGENFFAETITITDDEYIVVMMDPTTADAEFGFIQGLQIIPTPVDLRATSTFIAADGSLTIEFVGAPDTDYLLGQSDDLTGDFPPVLNVSAKTTADGSGSFSIPIDLMANPKSFFRITTQ